MVVCPARSARGAEAAARGVPVPSGWGKAVAATAKFPTGSEAKDTVTAPPAAGRVTSWALSDVAPSLMSIWMLLAAAGTTRVSELFVAALARELSGHSTVIVARLVAARPGVADPLPPPHPARSGSINVNSKATKYLTLVPPNGLALLDCAGGA